MGLSLGGFTALRLSLALPEIRGIILMAPAVLPVPSIFIKPAMKMIAKALIGLLAWIPMPKPNVNVMHRLDVVY